MNGITVKRIVGGSVLVTWIPVEMSSNDSRDSPLYNVTYTPSDGGHTSSIITATNSVNLTGLNSGGSYVISVQVTTRIVMNKDDALGMYWDDVLLIIGRLSARLCEGE